MGVYIKGMEMPTRCAECKPEWRSSLVSKEGARCYCRIAKQYGSLKIANQRRMDFCPLAPVPPHGRLIDADALHYSRIRIAHNDGTIGGYNAVVMSAEIKDAPTIIEAEEET